MHKIAPTTLLLNLTLALACDPIGDTSSSSTGERAPLACDPEAEVSGCPADRPRCVSSTQGGTLYTACASTCNEDRTCPSRDDICVDLGEQLKVCLPNCTEDSLCAPGWTCIRPTLIDLDIAQVCYPNPTP